MKQFLIIILILLMPIIVYAGFWTDVWNNLWGIETEELGATICYPYQGCTGISSYGRGDILIATSSNILYRVATGTEGQVLEIVSGIPAWSTDNTGGGGTGQWSTTTGDIIYYQSGDVLIGSNTTSTADFWFDIVNGNLTLVGGVTATGSISAADYSGDWLGNVIGTGYGGTGQNTGGWTGFPYITSGNWATATALTSVAPADMDADDFGDFSCAAGVCSIDEPAIDSLNLTNSDFGDWSCDGAGNCTIDTDVSLTMIDATVTGAFYSPSSTLWTETATWKSAAIDASDRLEMAYGGTEADLSAITTGGLITGTGAGSVGVLNVETDLYVLTASSTAGEGVYWRKVDISDTTNLVAGTGITLTGDSLSVDLGTEIDISDETNLGTSTAGITITDDAIGLVLGAIDHDQLLNFVAAEHIDWNATTSSFETSITALDASSSPWDTAYSWGDWSGEGFLTTVDISANTNLTAGDYITLTDDDLDIDAELSDYSFSIPVYRASTTMHIQRQKEYAYNITEISCWSENGSTTIQFDERASTTPASAGTDVMDPAIECTQDAMHSTTTFSNAAIAAGAILNLDIDLRTGDDTVNTYIFVNASVDD